jgi:hypothetical protein
VFCDSTAATIEVGNGSEFQYIWKEAWEWTGTQWIKHTLTGSNLVDNSWYIGKCKHHTH